MIATAPGKVLWSGEYAVLDGAPAVVMAVERRAVAEIHASQQHLSPFLEAARVEIGDRFGGGSRAAMAASRVRVDTTALADNGRKLGLGSSAAATVAAIAAALGETGPVHQLAHRAHARAQGARGARGSGADVAASVHGGVLEVHRQADDAPLAVRKLALPAGLDFVLIWTGTPADTPSLVVHVRELRARDPAAHAEAVSLIAEASVRLIAALDAADAAAAVAAIAAGAQAIAELGARAGAPLVPPAHAAVAALAAVHGGAAKPTGAGGGDLVLAVFPDDATAFREAARDAGMTLVAAEVAKTGVTAG